jgi:methylenetetrahydrofolate dehydrogenase (NADP+)/methenyltetrahydrofolate cyclohydrolase
MSHTTLLDGKKAAENLKNTLIPRVQALAARGIVPGLTVVLVGSDPASQVYVRNKIAQTKALGMLSREVLLPADTSEETLLATIDQLNADASVHGILVQLPLPKHLSEAAVIGRIAPEKDVDGFHIENVGLLATGSPRFVPCTPLGCMMLLQSLAINLAGLHAVVVGRSNIVGKPMAQLLLQRDCTVTIAHSRTQNLPAIVGQGDIVVAAVGRPQMVKAEWLKPGAIVLDVGINRITKPDGSTRLVGDVDFDGAMHVASAITPVPGGVGPMTIACLLSNTVLAAESR